MLHTIKLSRQMLLCAVCMSTEEEHKIYNNNNIIEKKKESHIFGYQPNHVIYTNLIRIYVSFSTWFYTRARCTRIFVKSAFLAGVCVCVCVGLQVRNCVSLAGIWVACMACYMFCKRISRWSTFMSYKIPTGFSTSHKTPESVRRPHSICVLSVCEWIRN